MNYFKMAKDLKPDATHSEIMDLCPGLILSVGPEIDYSSFYCPDIKAELINYYKQGCRGISCHTCWNQTPTRKTPYT